MKKDDKKGKMMKKGKIMKIMKERKKKERWKMDYEEIRNEVHNGFIILSWILKRKNDHQEKSNWEKRSPFTIYS